MTDDRPSTPSAALLADDRPRTDAGLVLPRAELDGLVSELHSLRNTDRRKLADRPHDARASGSPEDNEAVLAMHQEATITAARVVPLEDEAKAA